MFLAHDIKLVAHFSTIKTLSRLDKYHWKTKNRDTEKYCLAALRTNDRNTHELNLLELQNPQIV